jgi:hypothetical protein
LVIVLQLPIYNSLVIGTFTTLVTLLINKRIRFHALGNRVHYRIVFLRSKLHG